MAAGNVLMTMNGLVELTDNAVVFHDAKHPGKQESFAFADIARVGIDAGSDKRPAIFSVTTADGKGHMWRVEAAGRDAVPEFAAVVRAALGQTPRPVAPSVAAGADAPYVPPVPPRRKPQRKTLKLRLVKASDRRKHEKMLDDGWTVETEAPMSWGVGGKVITYRKD